MKKYSFMIWRAKDKFDNPSRAIYGERMNIEIFIPTCRRNYHLRLVRQFRSYFEWRTVDEKGVFDITVTKSVLDKLINVLKAARRDIYGEQP